MTKFLLLYKNEPVVFNIRVLIFATNDCKHDAISN